MTQNNNPIECIDVSLDLRQLKLKIDDRHSPKSALFEVWRYISNDLIGRSVSFAQKIELSNHIGQWSVFILDPRNVTVINENTKINIVDIEREPEIRHACKEHRKKNQIIFGPFFCPECRAKGIVENRLCEDHVRFLENKYTAYCPDHLPFCQCREKCTESATFECDYCHNCFSDRWKRQHPNDPFTLLCIQCYSFHFERCEDCEREGRKRLGKSRCAFPTSNGDERHGKRICTLRHARQWQIWGPHRRGIVLCEQHYQQLSQANPTELLWMLVTAEAPEPYLRNRVTDIYRLRNIVGYVRHQEFPWRAMEQSLYNLIERATRFNSPRYIGQNLKEMIRKISDAQTDLPVIEAQLLVQVRDFYRTRLRGDPTNFILGVAVKRVFGGKGKPQTYSIAIRVAYDVSGKSMKGLLIGRQGVLANQLREALKLYAVERIEFED